MTKRMASPSWNAFEVERDPAEIFDLFHLRSMNDAAGSWRFACLDQSILSILALQMLSNFVARISRMRAWPVERQTSKT